MKLGLAYGMDMVRRLISLVGHANAGLMLFGAERINAAEALRIGLVNRMVPAADLEKSVTKMAVNIVENAPRSVTTTRISWSRPLRHPFGPQRRCGRAGGQLPVNEGLRFSMNAVRPFPVAPTVKTCCHRIQGGLEIRMPRVEGSEKMV